MAEILLKGKKNIIVEYIYKHSCLEIDEFNVLFEQAMKKISAENKEICLLGDFTIVLLKINAENKIDEYYNIMSTNYLMLHLTLHTRITSESSTLTDNIYPNNLDIFYAIFGNLTVSISDHLPQFLVIPKDNMKNANRQNEFKREKNFDKECLVADVITIDWDSALSLDQVNIRNANKGQHTSFINGKITNDYTKIANSFNNYFPKVAKAARYYPLIWS